MEDNFFSDLSGWRMVSGWFKCILFVVHFISIIITLAPGWALKNWCFWTIVLEKTLESPLDSKEIKPVNPKGNQPWIFIRRTDAEAEALILWPPDAKCQLTRKDLDAGKDWGQERKGATEDEMVGWCHRVNGHEFEQTPRDSEEQGGLACYSPGGHRVGIIEGLNSNKLHLRPSGTRSWMLGTPVLHYMPTKSWTPHPTPHPGSPSNHAVLNSTPLSPTLTLQTPHFIPQLTGPVSTTREYTC